MKTQKERSVDLFLQNETYHYSSTIKDQLMSITDGFTNNSIIKEFKYESSYKGNPTAIITNGVSQTLTWEGRKLKQAGNTYFTYNEDGIRIRKIGTDYIEYYMLDGSKVIGLQRYYEKDGYNMYFTYDEQGEIVGLSCEGKEYFYIRDITGNIIKIIDEDGSCVVQYNYDAWGNFKKTIYIDCYASHRNPFVYKGYFFDEDTGWYYLKSRYYDPTIRRFINADDCAYLDTESLNGINLYSYCGNNPIIRIDTNGTSWKSFWKKVGNFFKGIGNWFKNTFGFSMNVGKEVGVENYYFLGSFETGVGYSKSFDNGKPVNFYLSVPDKWWQLWNYSIGLDVNINGYGAGIYVGPDTGVSLHCGNADIDLSINQRGQASFKYSYINEFGFYIYNKYSINCAELAVTVLAIYFGFLYASEALPLIAELLRRVGGEVVANI